MLGFVCGGGGSGVWAADGGVGGEGEGEGGGGGWGGGGGEGAAGGLVRGRVARFRRLACREEFRAYWVRWCGGDMMRRDWLKMKGPYDV